MKNTIEVINEQPKKCAVIDDDVKPCGALRRALEDGQNRKGLIYRMYFNMKTMKPSRSQILVKSGDFVKNGVTVNFCPFCGENIVHHFYEPWPDTGDAA